MQNIRTAQTSRTESPALTVSCRADVVVKEALRWLGTPYHHQADICGVGVDCAMLLVRVFVDIGAVLPMDPRPYPPDWYLHRDEERFLGWVKRYGARVESPSAGDVALFRFGRTVSHGAIMISPTTILHAFLPAGRVCLDDLHGWSHRLDSFWRVR